VSSDRSPQVMRRALERAGQAGGGWRGADGGRPRREHGTDVSVLRRQGARAAL